jgi:hypothetical protein
MKTGTPKRAVEAAAESLPAMPPVTANRIQNKKSQMPN